MSRAVGWYVRRLSRMSPREVASRSGDKARQVAWSRRQVRVGDPLPALEGLGVLNERSFSTTLPGWARDKVADTARAALLTAADDLLAGHWLVLGAAVPNPRRPDWFLDPVTGRHAPADTYCFRVDQRDESVTGNVKAVWELSRHHHVTVLAAAWWLTGEERYAETAAAHLRSWWKANPFLSGVHWTSGIEIGIRLIAWAWTRRLLEGWPGAADLFENDADALRQIAWHQEYLAAFRSSGTSANNHLVAEAAGRLVAAAAFPWYAASEAWRADAAVQLADSLAHNTHPSGINKEQATEYQCFVSELALVAAAEAERAGHPLPAETWQLLASSLDAMAAISDSAGRPPRQGDGDEGRALLVDDPEADAWDVVLATGAETLGDAPWWPRTEGGIEPVIVAALAGQTVGRLGKRPQRRPDVFADAGLTLLRTPAGETPEIWCRCDGGPHGFGSIAAHAHADALAVEVRYDGVEVLVDPGTYCYHGDPAWRSYFRSTRAHNTIEIDGTNQSREGGPFLWTTHAETTVELADSRTWRARVTGHSSSPSSLTRRGVDRALVHRRTARLEAAERVLHLTDEVTGDAGHALSLAFHLGPQIGIVLGEGERADTATLTWDHAGRAVTALLTLPRALTWTAHRGESAPPLGWHSPAFGTKVAITTLVGTGHSTARHPVELSTSLAFEPEGGVR